MNECMARGKNGENMKKRAGEREHSPEDGRSREEQSRAEKRGKSKAKERKKVKKKERKNRYEIRAVDPCLVAASCHASFCVYIVVSSSYSTVSYKWGPWPARKTRASFFFRFT